MPVRLHKVTIVIALLYAIGMQGQLNDNISVVKNMYEVIQKNSTTSKEIIALTPNIDWSQVTNTKEVNERYTITFLAILKNEWRGISFQKLKFQETEKNKILVTGNVSGRQPTECEGVTTAFQHLWTLKDGEIINFNEY
jgi:hypothetical protein